MSQFAAKAQEWRQAARAYGGQLTVAERQALHVALTSVQRQYWGSRKRWSGGYDLIRTRLLERRFTSQGGWRTDIRGRSNGFRLNFKLRSEGLGGRVNLTKAPFNIDFIDRKRIRATLRRMIPQTLKVDK